MSTLSFSLPRSFHLSARAVVIGLILALAGTAAAQPAFTNTGSLNTGRSRHTATLLPNGQVLVTGGGVSGANASSSAELYNPATDAWTAIASMNSARTLPTATLLPNGQVLVAGGFDNTGNALASAELYDPAAGTWVFTGNLNTARYGHTATLLANGKVLVVGGAGPSGATGSAELYDPATGKWTAVASLNVARYGDTATLLPNGQVLVAGGDGNFTGALGSAELYDPAGNTWTLTGSLNTARAAHTATLLPNGQVLVAGGVGTIGQPTATAELFASGTWTATASLNTARSAHTTTLLPNGQVLVAGGNDTTGQPSATAELFDNGTWTAAASLNTARAEHTATLLAGGEVLMVGGNGTGTDLANAEVYEPVGTWTGTGGLNTARYNHTATLLPNGQVLAAGGYDASNDSSLSAELFAGGAWTTTGSLNSARTLHTATLLANGNVLVAGGLDINSLPLASAELYDVTSGTWAATDNMIHARSFHTATLLGNGKVLVAGGLANNSPLASTELYDPATGTWTLTGNLHTARYSHTATLLPGGQVLVVGGQDASGDIFASAELYDPLTGAWTVVGSLNDGRYNHTATLLPSGQVLVAGGVDSTLSPIASAELYDPATGSWTTTGNSMNDPREAQTATLLPTGQVLVAGGNSGAGATNTAEVYDPGLGTWTAIASLNAARYSHTATLLPTGQVLVAGGYNNAGVASASAELYDEGLGFDAAWQPQVTDATSALAFASSLVLTGTGFQGISGASGGDTQDSSTNYPVVQLRSLVNEQTVFLLSDPASPWSNTSFASAPVIGFPTGYAMATVFTNGIPSTSSLIEIPAPLAAVTSTIALSGTVPGTSGSSTYFSFGTASSTGAFAGDERTGKVKTAAIFGADGSVLLKVSGTVSGLTIAKLGVPSGDAVVVTLKAGGSVTAKNAVALVTGLSSGAPAIFARTGTAETGLAAGVTIRSFLTIDGNGTNTFFLAGLQGTGITSKNAVALCAAEPGGTVNVVAEGEDPVTVKGFPETVSLITTLQSSALSAAQGRWRAGDDDFGFRTALASKRTAIFDSPATAAGPGDWNFVTETGTIGNFPALNGAVKTSFGLPAFSHDTVATIMNLEKGRGGVLSTDDVALVSATAGGSFGLLARTGNSAPDQFGAPMPGINFKTLNDPVSGADGEVAFIGTIAGSGVTAANSSGIWFTYDGVTLKLLAGAGTGTNALAPGGGHWSKFKTLVLPDAAGYGPIFIGTLGTSHADGVTPKNNLGLWALDSNGTLELLLRSGQSLSGKTVETFTALVPAIGSAGAASGYDNDGNVSALVTFTNKTQEVVVLSVP